MNFKHTILYTIIVCQSISAQTSYNIYPVAGEIFQASLQELLGFEQAFTTGVFISGSSVPFTVSSFGTLFYNNLEINGSIISTTQALQYGNPNIPNNRYGYLVQVFNESNSSQSVGYQLYEAQLLSNGSINPMTVSPLFNPSNSTCYTAEYIQIPLYQNSLLAAVCLTDNQDGSSNLGLYYSVPDSQILLYLAANYYNPFVRSQVESVETQVTTSLTGQVYFSVLYFTTLQFSMNFLYIYQLVQEGELPFLNLIDNGYGSVSNNNINAFYLANDLSLFILESNQITVYNGTNYIINGNTISYTLPTNSITGGNYFLNVYQTAPNTNDQLFYLAIANFYEIFFENTFRTEQYIAYLTFVNGTFNFINNYYVDSVSSLNNVFITPDIVIIINSDSVLALPGPIVPSFNYYDYWDFYYAGQSFSTFDDYNNVLIVSSNNGQMINMQFEEQQLITPYPLNTSTPNGNFTLTVNTVVGQSSYNINYFVVPNSSLAAVYEIQQSIPAYVLSISENIIEPSEYLTGPNLKYTSQFSQPYEQQIQQWSVLNITNQVDCSYIQNFANDTALLQIFQINNGSIYTFVQICDFNECQAPLYINYINQQVQQIFITEYSSPGLVVQYESPSYIVTVIQTSDIFNVSSWSLLTTVNITIFFNQIGQNTTIESIAALYNNLYIVTANPSSLIAVQVTESSYYQIANTQFDNYAPQNVWVNSQEYGEIIFIDNVYELVVLQLVNQTFFTKINSISYPVNNYDSIILGNIDYGFFLTFSTNGQSQIFFYPYYNYQTISFTQNGYTTTPGTFNYTINSTIYTSSQNYQYFTDNQTLLVYQYAQSSVGSLYTTYTFPLNIQSISAISVISNLGQGFDIISILLENGNVQTISLKTVPVLQTFVQFSNQYLIQGGQINFNVSSNGVVQEQLIVPTVIYCYEDNYTITANGSGNQLLILQGQSQNKNDFTWSYKYYPYPDFLGSIDTLTASYQSNISQINSSKINLNTNMVQMYNPLQLDSFNAQSFYYSDQLGVISQNLLGSYFWNTNNPNNVGITNLFTFPFSTQSCPYIGQYNSTQYISVCTLANSSTVIFIYTTKNYQVINAINVTGVIVSAFYQNGIFTLSSQTNSFVCALNLSTSQQVYCQLALTFDQSVSNVQNIETIQIFNPINQSLNQSYGLLVPQGQYVQFLIITVNDQTSDSNLLINFNFTNSTQSLFNYIELIYSSSPINGNNIYQIVQTQNSTQNNSLVQVSVLFANSFYIYGLNFYFNISDSLNPVFNDVILQCGYVPSSEMSLMYYTTTAINDLIVSIYTSSSSNFQGQQQIVYQYIAYRSSNTLFGGNGSPVCMSEGENIPMVNYLGQTDSTSTSNEVLSNNLLTILQNGQVFSAIGYQTQIIQLSSGYDFSGTLPNAYINETIPIQLTATNLDTLALNTYILNISSSSSYIPQDSFNYKLFWIIFGSCLGGLIVIGIIVLIVCKCKKQDNQNMQQAEYQAMPEDQKTIEL